MSENALQHLITGQARIADQPAESPAVLALSENLSEVTIIALQQAATLAPLPINGVLESQAIALAMLENGKTVGDASRVFVLARSHYQDESQSQPAYQYIQIPGALLDGLGGDIQPLLKLLDDPIPTYNVTHAPLDPLSLPGIETGSLDKEITALQAILDQLGGDDLRRLLAVLGAALEGGVIICSFPLDPVKRLALVRGLTMLLPRIARSHLTFTTHTTVLNGRLPRVTFSEADGAPNLRRFDWNQQAIDETLLEQPYVAHLLHLWRDDVLTLAGILQTLNALAMTIMPGQFLVDGLQAVVERHQHDLAVIQREPLAAEVVMNILDSATPPDQNIRLLYLEHLLRLALNDRNTEAAQRVAHEMDQDAALDEQLQTVFDDALQTQPDAVYVFVRTRLADGIDERWLDRLHQAAEKSLDVAVESGDTATLSSWLNLISREPSRYKLADVLRAGILAARKRAPDSPELTQDLLVMSVKRLPEILSTLLQDAEVMQVLPEQILDAIERFNTDAIERLYPESRELFLLAVKRALDAGDVQMASNIVRQIWEIHIQQQVSILAPEFRPLTLIKQIAKNSNLLVPGTLEIMLTLILAGSQDELFFGIAPDLAQQDELAGVIATVLHQSGRNLPDLISIVSKLTAEEILDAQDTVATYTALLQHYTAPETTLPLVEQLARVLVQHPETTASIGMMWRIAERSNELKSESMLRVATRRLLHDIEQMVSEAQVIESIQRLRKAINWSAPGRSSLIRWWRQYTRIQGLVQLQKLDKELDGKRHLEDLRAIVQTSIALRRVLGQRTLEEFASDIHTTFTILQALGESFDPDGKSSVAVDIATIRGEMDAREEELPPEMRQVLATNLRELAQLITNLSDNRSKPAILRSDESVERQLYIGEAQPQSAIDVMRWLSGYLVGMQKDDEDD